MSIFNLRFWSKICFVLVIICGYKNLFVNAECCWPHPKVPCSDGKERYDVCLDCSNPIRPTFLSARSCGINYCNLIGCNCECKKLIPTPPPPPPTTPAPTTTTTAPTTTIIIAVLIAIILVGTLIGAFVAIRRKKILERSTEANGDIPLNQIRNGPQKPKLKTARETIYASLMWK